MIEATQIDAQYTVSDNIVYDKIIAAESEQSCMPAARSTDKCVD